MCENREGMAMRCSPATAESSARRTLEVIAAHGPMTVRELVGALGVTTTAVREQVNRLSAGGWLERAQRRGKTGRPADVFALSGKANRLFAGQLDDFARLLVDELVTQVGRQESRELLKRVGQRMAQGARDEIGGGPPDQRLERLGRLLAQRGDAVQTGRVKEGLRLTLHRCPYGSLADQHAEICEMERQTFGCLVGGDVRLQKLYPQGSRQCEFTIRPAGDGGRTARATKRRTTDVDGT